MASDPHPTIDPHASEPHASDAPGHEGAVAHHAADDHGDDHGHDDHAHDDEALGPVNWPLWIAGGAGVLLGLAVTVALVLATAPATPG